jgi:hypothetical protein
LQASKLKERIKLLPDITALIAAGRSPGARPGRRLKVITIICCLFVANPFHVGFRALVIPARIVEAAIAAAMHAELAPRALITAADPFSAFQLNRSSALPAVKTHFRTSP